MAVGLGVRVGSPSPWGVPILKKEGATADRRGGLGALADGCGGWGCPPSRQCPGAGVVGACLKPLGRGRLRPAAGSLPSGSRSSCRVCVLLWGLVAACGAVGDRGAFVGLLLWLEPCSTLRRGVGGRVAQPI